jgi:hypothetical protein
MKAKAETTFIGAYLLDCGSLKEVRTTLEPPIVTRKALLQEYQQEAQESTKRQQRRSSETHKNGS